ncbi:DUF6494 family protein [Aestuariispira insulae]|uniref:Uncharacterized protein n=1 Tax=Aestuariispira insulae TaxID=1461337 RepID=A0A3D9HS07_9PROT|nr:DUF6494 family protein [Aestuariispira insulae]RED52195.1 hypothetical protein DFP90_102213 [Aestuariispira insulae]
MNEDIFNMSTRKFLKKVGITTQRELEKAVWKAEEEGALGEGPLKVEMKLSVNGVALDLAIQGEIELS